MEISEAYDDLDGLVFSVAALATDLDADQCDQRGGGADITVIASVRERPVGNGDDGTAVRSAGMVRHGLARGASCIL